MSDPRRPDVMIRLRLKPSFSASGPIISWDPGPRSALGKGWNSLIGNGFSSSSTCMGNPFRCGGAGWTPNRMTCYDLAAARNRNRQVRNAKVATGLRGARAHRHAVLGGEPADLGPGQGPDVPGGGPLGQEL